ISDVTQNDLRLPACRLNGPGRAEVTDREPSRPAAHPCLKDEYLVSALAAHAEPGNVGIPDELTRLQGVHRSLRQSLRRLCHGPLRLSATYPSNHLATI